MKMMIGNTLEEVARFTATGEPLTQQEAQSEQEEMQERYRQSLQHCTAGRVTAVFEHDGTRWKKLV